MITHILITIIFYFALMLVSTNLLGLFVRSLFGTRGIFINSDIERLKTEGDEIIKQEIKKYETTSRWFSSVVFLLIVVYLYLIFHFWNIGVAAVAMMFILARLPDLLWEIKTGKKKSIMPNSTLSFIINFLLLVLIPVLYYFLYIFNKI